MSSHSVSIGILSQLVQYIRFLGIDEHRLFASVGLDPAVLDNPDEQIPFDKYIALENNAAKLSGDPCFGLHMGEFITPGHYNIIGYMMMNSRNLGQPLMKLGKYNRLIGTVISGKVQPGFQKARLFLNVPKNAPDLSRHCTECAASSIISLARRLCGKQINPLAVSFSFPPPGDDAEYTRVFQAPVRFGEKHTVLEMDHSIGAFQTVQPNPRLLEYFERYAQEYIAKLEEYGPLSKKVVKLFLAKSDQRNLSI
ncbi:MAG: AraC family transcriptional regulator [Spirochaetia bacterium]